MSTSVDKLVNEIIGLRKQVAGLTGGPQLAFSSIEDGAIDEYDEEGVLSSQIGLQWDGTHNAVSLAGPVPPTPTTPQVTVGARSLTVRWDGRFQGGATSPMDLKQVEVVMATDAAETDAAIRATIVGELGAEVVVAPLPEVEHYVWLVARTFSGKASNESISVQATPAEVVAPGTVITGAIIQTDYAADRGIKILSPENALRMWDPNGVLMIDADGDTGNFDLRGTIRSKLSAITYAGTTRNVNVALGEITRDLGFTGAQLGVEFNSDDPNQSEPGVIYGNGARLSILGPHMTGTTGDAWAEYGIGAATMGFGDSTTATESRIEAGANAVNVEFSDNGTPARAWFNMAQPSTGTVQSVLGADGEVIVYARDGLSVNGLGGQPALLSFDGEEVWSGTPDAGIAFANGWSDYPGYNPFITQKIAPGMVTLTGMIEPGTTTNDAKVGTIGETAHRPKVKQYLPMTINEGGYHAGVITIEPNGDIRQRGYPDGVPQGYATISVNYPV